MHDRALYRAIQADYVRQRAKRRRTQWRPPDARQEHLESQMVAVLKSLTFQHEGKHITAPALSAQEAAAQQVQRLLEQAHALGRGDTRSITWSGGKSLLGSAWNVISRFVNRIITQVTDWITEQPEEDVTEEALEAEVSQEVDTLSETVALTEVQSVVQQAVLDGLEGQGRTSKSWNAQPGACPTCLDNAEQGPIPIGETFASGDMAPPAHGRCRCGLEEGENA